MSYIYLASPYSHPDPAVREARYRAARDTAAWMLAQRLWVYSPIVHCHDLAQSAGLPTDFAFWGEYNRAMIASAESLYVLLLPGYLESVGVNAEIAYALSARKPVVRLAIPPQVSKEGLAP